MTNLVVESISPARLGTSFRWLLTSSWVSNIGDGIGLAAGPLLVASQTHDPLLVASAALLQLYMMGVHGGLVVGAAIGGLVARAAGVTAPFWFAFVGSGLILVAIWQALGHIAHTDG